MQIPRPSGRMKASLAFEAWLSSTGKKQVDVVLALDVSKQLVSFWVTGRGVPGLEKAEQLEKLTGGAVKVMDWREPAAVTDQGGGPRGPNVRVEAQRMLRAVTERGRHGLAARRRRRTKPPRKPTASD